MDIVDELEYDTADPPHVSGDIVSFLNKRYLGCSIPASLNMWRYRSFWLNKLRLILNYFNGSKASMSGLFRNASFLDLFGDALRHGSSQSEVAYLNIQGQWVNKNVSRLQIPVDDVGKMKKLHRTKHVIDYFLYFWGSELSVIQQIFQTYPK